MWKNNFFSASQYLPFVWSFDDYLNFKSEQHILFFLPWTQNCKTLNLKKSYQNCAIKIGFYSQLNKPTRCLKLFSRKSNSPCFSFEELGTVTTHFQIEMVSVLYIDYCLTFQSFLCLMKHVLYVFLNLAPLERQIRFSLKTLSPPANILMANF